MKRRIFLQAIGLSAIATRGYTANADAAARFTHGVASGDPLSDRVILWSRVIPQKANDTLTVFWQVATDQGFARVVASGETTVSADSDYTVKVDATGLQPDQRYFYRFNARGVSSCLLYTSPSPRDS